MIQNNYDKKITFFKEKQPPIYAYAIVKKSDT